MSSLSSTPHHRPHALADSFPLLSLSSLAPCTYPLSVVFSQPSASPQLQYFLPLLLLNDQFGSLLTALKVSGHIFYLSQKLFRAFCPESFCACNSAIRKVLAFCASGWYLEVCRWLCSCVCSSPAGAQGCREPGTGRQSLNVRRGRSTKQVLSITRCPQLSLPPPTRCCHPIVIFCEPFIF